LTRIMNFNNEEKKVNLLVGYEVISGNYEEGTLKPYGVVVLKKQLSDEAYLNLN